MSVNHAATCKDSLFLDCTMRKVSLHEMRQSKHECTWMNVHFCPEWKCVAACRGVTLTTQGPFWKKKAWTTWTRKLFVHFAYSEKRNEEIKTTPSNIVMSNLLLPVSSFLFFQSLSCPASSSGPFPQSVPVPPLAPARPPAPVPGLATQTKTHCLAQFNWLV